MSAVSLPVLYARGRSNERSKVSKDLPYYFQQPAINKALQAMNTAKPVKPRLAPVLTKKWSLPEWEDDQILHDNR